MKRILSILLVVLLIILQVPSIGLADTTYDPAIYKPAFGIENGEVPSINAGSNTTISLTLKNSNGSARDVVLTPIFEGGSPFTSNSLTNNISLGNINSGAKVPIKLDLSVSPTAEAGTYPITLSFKYKYYSYDGSNYTSIDEKYEEVVYVKIGNKTSQPKLIITKTVTNPETINPGQNIRASVMFENKGSLDAKNVSVKLEGLNNNGGFYISSGSDTAFIKNVSGNSISFADFHLKASNNIKKGGHELKVTFSYNGLPAETQIIYLNVGGDSSQGSNLLLENLTYPTGAIKPNNDFVLKFDLRNNGGIDAKNILVKIESSDPVIIPKTTSIQKINNIAPSTSESLEFIFSPTSEATTKNYPINISIQYEDELTESKNEINQYVGVYVEKPGESDNSKGKPKLIIDKYSFNPSLVKAGENFEMNLSFYNTNSSKAIKNIKIFLTSNEKTDPNSNSGGGSVFTPVDSSNTFYIDSIPPKGRVEKKITMFTVPDAQAKTYTLTANFEYEDNEGNEYPAEELIGVPVVQQSKLDTGELQLYPEAMVGQPLPVSLEFYNTGKVTLYNMMVKLEGDFQTENGSYYVGNFNSGSSEYFEGMVIPSQPGELKGAVLFTYEDSTGQMQELRKEFTLNVMEMPPMEEFPGEMPPTDGMKPGGIKGILKSKWLWISIVVIAAITGGFVFYKKKKKAKEMALDE